MTSILIACIFCGFVYNWDMLSEKTWDEYLENLFYSPNGLGDKIVHWLDTGLYWKMKHKEALVSEDCETWRKATTEEISHYNKYFDASQLTNKAISKLEKLLGKATVKTTYSKEPLQHDET